LGWAYRERGRVSFYILSLFSRTKSTIVSSKVPCTVSHTESENASDKYSRLVHTFGNTLTSGRFAEESESTDPSTLGSPYPDTLSLGEVHGKLKIKLNHCSGGVAWCRQHRHEQHFSPPRACTIPLLLLHNNMDLVHGPLPTFPKQSVPYEKGNATSPTACHERVLLLHQDHDGCFFLLSEATLVRN